MRHDNSVADLLHGAAQPTSSERAAWPVPGNNSRLRFKLDVPSAIVIGSSQHFAKEVGGDTCRRCFCMHQHNARHAQGKCKGQQSTVQLLTCERYQW